MVDINNFSGAPRARIPIAKRFWQTHLCEKFGFGYDVTAVRQADRPTVRTYAPSCNSMSNETLKPCAATRVFFGGKWARQFLWENKREFWRKLIVVLVEYSDKRHMSRKQVTNEEIWKPRATEGTNNQAKCQLKTNMWWVSNSQVAQKLNATLQTIVGRFLYLTYFKLHTNT